MCFPFKNQKSGRSGKLIGHSSSSKSSSVSSFFKCSPRCSPLCWWKKHVFPIFFKSQVFGKWMYRVFGIPNRTKMGSSSWVPMAATTVISGVSTVTVIPDNPGNYPLKSPGIYPITRHIPNKTSLCLTSSRFSICGYPGYLIFAVSSIFLAARSAAW